MSKVVTIFGKKGCAKCDTTRRKIDHLISKRGLASQVTLRFHDMETPEGVAEAAFLDVAHIPTTMVEVGEGDARRWDGEVPHSGDVLAILQGDESGEAAH